MATARKPRIKINLLPQEEFLASTPGRILKWLLSTFRIIVILTEGIVMAAFLSRFWLDAKANDLNSSIRQKQAVIAATSEFESEYKNVQDKLEAFSKITLNQKEVSKYLGKVTTYIPTDILLNSFQTTEDSIQIQGSSASEASVAQFISNLKNDSDFKKVKLMGTGISQKDMSLIIFNIKIELTEEGKK